jgi:hypothetical protein
VSPDDDDFGIVDDDWSWDDDNWDDDWFIDDDNWDDDQWDDDYTYSPTYSPTEMPTYSPTAAANCEAAVVEIKGKKNGCVKYVAKGKDKKIRKKCNKKHKGEKIYDICVETCGMVGLGQCSHLG